MTFHIVQKNMQNKSDVKQNKKNTEIDFVQSWILWVIQLFNVRGAKKMIIGDTRHVSHDVLLVQLHPGLSLGWWILSLIWEQIERGWQSSYSRCETASVTAQQCCSWAAGII